MSASSLSSVSKSPPGALLQRNIPLESSLGQSIAKIKQIIAGAWKEVPNERENPFLDKICCPITFEPIKEPWVTKCGHTFEESALKAALAINRLCPMCNTADPAPVPNFALRDMIKSWRKEPAIVTFSHFREPNQQRAVQYLKTAENFVRLNDIEEALKVYSQAFEYTRTSHHYAVIPTLYSQLGDHKKAALSHLYLCLYELEDGKIPEAARTLRKCNLHPLKIASAIQKLKLELAQSSEILTKETRIFFPGVVMSKEQWATGDIKHLPPYPPELVKFLKKDCIFWPKQKRSETHIVFPLFSHVDLHGDGFPLPLTLDSLGLLDTSSGGKGYKYISYKVLTDQPAEREFHWAVMTKKAIPGSENKTYKEQIELCPENYELPLALQAALALLWARRRDKVRYFQVSNNTYSWDNDKVCWIRCKDGSRSRIYSVGGHYPEGLQVGVDDVCENPTIGIAALQIF